MVPDPLFSVVMASYNAEEFIAEAIGSALADDAPSLEVLVQDGASTDGTVAAVKAIGDSRVSLVSEPDEGQSSALNAALARACGEWIIWLNADDLLAPGWAQAAVPCIADDVEAIFGDWAYIDPTGGITRRWPVAALERDRLLTVGQYPFSGATFFRRSVYERFGNLDTSLRMAMDYDFFLRVAPHIEAVRCPATLAYFRQHGSSITTEINWRLIRETGRVRRRHGGYASLHTAGPIFWNEIKQVIDVTSLPLRKRFRRRVTSAP